MKTKGKTINRNKQRKFKQRLAEYFDYTCPECSHEFDSDDGLKCNVLAEFIQCPNCITTWEVNENLNQNIMKELLKDYDNNKVDIFISYVNQLKTEKNKDNTLPVVTMNCEVKR